MYIISVEKNDHRLACIKGLLNTLKLPDLRETLSVTASEELSLDLINKIKTLEIQNLLQSYFNLPNSKNGYWLRVVNTLEVQADSNLGVGGFGAVKKGAINNKTVAVKVLRLDRQDQKNQRALIAESQLHRQLSHQNIIDCHGLFSTKQHFGFLMDLACSSFHDYIYNENSQYASRQLKTIWLGIIRAVDYLHNLKPQVVHHDLKPQNILLDAQLNPKVTDFGLSKMVLKPQEKIKCAGTFLYMAPEVLVQEFQDPKLRHKLDIYSLALLLNESIQRQPPNIPGGGKIQIMAHKLNPENTLFVKNITSKQLQNTLLQGSAFLLKDRPEAMQLHAQIKKVKTERIRLK